MKRILVIAAMAALWSSCSENEICVTEKDSNQISISPAIIESTITSSAPGDTRTGYSGTTAAWANGDAIGIFSTEALASNVQFTASGAGASATWSTTTPIYWLDGTTSHKFLAYYPYASGNTSAASVKIPALNAQTGTMNPALDFMISNNQGTTGMLRTTDPVALTFTHAFTLIELKIQTGGGIAANSTLTNATLTGGVAEKLFTSDANSTIALSTGTITAGTASNTTTVTPSPSPTLSASPTSLYAFMLPGTYVGPINLTITFKDGGSTSYTTPATSIVTLAFLPATKYTYTVTISRTAITISNPTISDWALGTGGSLNPVI